MQMHKKAWMSDEGGIDFVQVVVGLLIIGIAAVGTLQAMFYGYEQLDYQMRYRKAISIARSYVEYLQGRIHTDFNPGDAQFMAGNQARPETVLLDKRDPSTNYDDIYCDISYGRIDPIDDDQTGRGVDWYKIRVYLSWQEPSIEPDQKLDQTTHQIWFDATMVPAKL